MSRMLTTVALCFASTAASAATQTTQFNGNSSNTGIMFGVQIGPADITIESFGLNTVDPGLFFFYLKLGKHVGSETTLGNRTRIDGHGFVPTAGRGKA